MYSLLTLSRPDPRAISILSSSVELIYFRFLFPCKNWCLWMLLCIKVNWRLLVAEIPEQESETSDFLDALPVCQVSFPSSSHLVNIATYILARVSKDKFSWIFLKRQYQWMLFSYDRDLVDHIYLWYFAMQVNFDLDQLITITHFVVECSDNSMARQSRSTW